jgi:predicted ATPase
VTLTGPPGTGKTRLAVEVAAELAGVFPDCVAFVALASVSDPDRVVPAVEGARRRLHAVGTRGVSGRSRPARLGHASGRGAGPVTGAAAARIRDRCAA